MEINLQVSTIEQENNATVINMSQKIEKSEIKNKQAAVNEVDFEPKFKTESLEKAIEAVNDMLNVSPKDVRMIVHEKSNRIIIQIINKETGEVIKEIPPAKIIELVMRLEEIVGLVIDEKR